MYSLISKIFGMNELVDQCLSTINSTFSVIFIGVIIILILLKIIRNRNFHHKLIQTINS